MMELDGRRHLVYGIAFTVISLFMLSLIVFFGSRADNTTGTASVNNAAPTVDTVITTASSGGSAASDITISESPSTTTVYVRGQVTDLNGCEQVSTTNGDWQLKMYRTGASGAGSDATCTTADNNDCYNFTESNVTVSGCTAGGEDTTTDYEFSATLQYWVDPTDAGSAYASDDWTSKVTVTDSVSATASSTSAFEVDRLLALIPDSSISYGTLALGATSASDVATTITSSGNGAIDMQVSASGDMSCNGIGSGSVPVGNAKYHLTASTAYGSMAALSTTPASVDISIAARTSESTATTGTIYNKIQIPSTGVSGSCTNTVTYTAVADASSGGSTSSGPNNPSAGVDDDSYGSEYWGSPEEVYANDGSYASASLTSNSHYLKTGGYGFSIPSGATIDGIILAIERYGFDSDTTVDDVVKLVKAGSVVGSNKASASEWPTSEAYAIYGSSTDLWGTTWTASQINASDFGAVLAAYGNGATAGAYVDHMRITVHYTE